MKQRFIKYLTTVRHALEVDRHRQLLENRVVYCGDHVVLSSLPNGKKIYLDMRDASLAASIALGRSYESHVSGTLARVARHGDTFFDVGANVGYHALMVHEHLAHDRVSMHLFEPNPDIFSCLRRSIHANGMWSSVKVNAHALSDSEGTATLRIFEDLLGSGTMTDDEGVAGADHRWQRQDMPAKSFDVRMRTLDSYCDEFDVSSIGLMKMDVEGHEDSVVAGMSATLERSGDLRLVMEFTPGAYRDGEAFWSTLKDLFPHRYVITGNGELSAVTTYDALRSLMEFELADLLLSRVAIE